MLVLLLLLPITTALPKKQGILEIPKQAATLIRNFIDTRIQTYLNLTTPRPDPSVPKELNNSILGHLLLGHLFAPIGNAQPYDPDLLGTVKPVISNYEVTGKSKTTTKPSFPTQAPDIKGVLVPVVIQDRGMPTTFAPQQLIIVMRSTTEMNDYDDEETDVVA